MIEGDLAGFDAVVHLAGESIAEGRWTSERKRRILESRQKGTRLLAEKLAGLAEPPSVMVSASAIGYYGDRGNELLTEESEPGTMFPSEVCKGGGRGRAGSRPGCGWCTRGSASHSTGRWGARDYASHLQARRRRQDRFRETVLVLGLAFRRCGRRHRSCHRDGCSERSR